MTTATNFSRARLTSNGQAVALTEIPLLPMDDFRQEIVGACAARARLSALAVLPVAGGRHLLALLSFDQYHRLGFLRTAVPADGHYPALTPALPQAQSFERELWEEHGIVPEGHPWCKPLRRHAELEGSSGLSSVGSDPYPFFRVEGPGIHEVAVGPVHAGIIEPGHFRFQCQGETILHLEIQLGYQHRAVEALLMRSSPTRRLAITETIAGDTSVAHATAYCMVLEALSGVTPPPLADEIRGIGLELERLANHVGDLGALCNDVGYLPGASWFGRLRGDFLNMSLEICGSRFGRGLLIPGGVRSYMPGHRREALLRRLQIAETDLCHIAEVTFQSPAVVSRFEGTGVVSQALAETLGLVGVAARASGCDRDVRRDHPFGVFGKLGLQTEKASSGGVMARAEIRRRESEASIQIVRQRVNALSDGLIRTPLGPSRSHSVAVALVEGWRGEVAHMAATDGNGQWVLYKIVDPSFHNWPGLAMAMRGGQISDFPLCNKSFNLSYAGHDL